MTNISQIDHIAIAVFNIEKAKNFYENALGLKIYKYETIKERGIKTAFIKIGDTKLELIEPLHEQSEISKFLNKNGEGVHHIAFKSQNLNDDQIKIKEQNCKVIYDTPQKGANDTLINFIHPKSTNGVLIEIVQKNN